MLQKVIFTYVQVNLKDIDVLFHQISQNVTALQIICQIVQKFT